MAKGTKDIFDGKVSIEPFIRVNGEQHPFEKMFAEKKEEEMPIFKAVGFGKDIYSHNKYIPYIFHVQGTKVIKIECGELMEWAVADEATKMNHTDTFIDQENW